MGQYGRPNLALAGLLVKNYFQLLKYIVGVREPFSSEYNCFKVQNTAFLQLKTANSLLVVLHKSWEWTAGPHSSWVYAVSVDRRLTASMLLRCWTIINLLTDSITARFSWWEAWGRPARGVTLV